MADIPEPDLDEMLLVLNAVIRRCAEGSKERDATELAQLALLYIRESGKRDDFTRYRERCVNTSFTIEVSHEFTTWEEAELWLASGQARHAEHVKIAGKGFLAVQLPGRMSFIDRPLPEELGPDE
ncbi:hypothetical protein [Melittangium boletus]|uniref:hypothetical protein n=1 Tax=Melittangium boletus TaxID=83453 RepID=UPI003DA53F50